MLVYDSHCGCSGVMVGEAFLDRAAAPSFYHCLAPAGMGMGIHSNKRGAFSRLCLAVLVTKLSGEDVLLLII